MHSRLIGKNIHFLLTLLAFLFIFSLSAYASKKGEIPPERKQEIESKAANLKRLIESMDYLSGEIAQMQQVLNSPEGKGTEDLLKKKIDTLSRKLISMEESFDFLASEVSFQKTTDSMQKEFNWNKELKTLIEPLIRELQRITLRPREIEKLRSDIELYEERLETTSRAIENLDLLLSSSAHPRLREKLLKSREMWASRNNEMESLKNISVAQLEKKTEGDESIAQSVQKVPGIFFKSHGKHILIAFLAMVVSAFIMYRLHEIIRRYSPLHADDRSIYVRVFDLSYLFIAFVFSLIITLGVLYFFSDWVLLSLVLVFIIGLLWASKEALPRAWSQVRLILNLGPVREGELIVYKGLPYRVMIINLYTVIENPMIECGKIRLPIADLLGLRSRPATEDEPWFPSKKGNWVLLNNNLLGKVVSQTPETVRLNIVGGATVSYNTAEYLSLSPMNLSSGFRLRVRFPLDFSHQDIITGQLPEILRGDILAELRKNGHGEAVSAVSVQFLRVSDLSLDIEIAADFFGKAGGDYFVLERIIQKACVDSCNKNKWIIPSLRFRVNMGDKNEERKPAFPE